MSKTLKTTKWTPDQRIILNDSASGISGLLAEIVEHASKLSPNPSPEFQKILETAGAINVAIGDIRLVVRESIPEEYR